MTTRMIAANTPTIRYIAFDKTTGRIVGEHSSYSSTEQKYFQIDEVILRKLLLNDTALIADLTNKDPDNLGILEIGADSPSPTNGPAMVDRASGRLIAQPRLTLSTNRHQITGDGADNALIEIKLLGSDGRIKHDFEGAVKVSTSRGRLSAPGGVVKLQSGRASITLTSVAETVASVHVSATAVDALAATAELVLEFL